MKRTLMLVTTLLLAGCVDPSDATLQPAAVATDAAAPLANTTHPHVPPAVSVATDAQVTRNDVAALFINTTAPIDVVVEVDGLEAAREAIAASATRSIPLSFGVNSILVTLSAPGFEQKTQLSVVRLGQTTVTIDYGVFHPGSQGAPRVETFDVWIDVDSRPSAPAYTEQGIEHIDLFTAHDQLVVFELVTGRKVEFEYFPSFQGFGVSRIDGTGSPVSSDAPPWWCYNVNGASADGISIQAIVPGDVVTWELGSCT